MLLTFTFIYCKKLKINSEYIYFWTESIILFLETGFLTHLYDTYILKCIHKFYER